MAKLILASASPRRQELLQQLGLTFVTCAVDIDETPATDELPNEYVLRMAKEKAAAAAAQFPYDLVLGADTSVIFNEKIYGKPRNFQHAASILNTLSGNKHQVLTAVAVQQGGKQASCIQCSDVGFAVLSEAQIKQYWESGEPRDKAGAYAIQGLAARFITHLKGSYSGVMGLPLYETAQLLEQFDETIFQHQDV